MNNADFVIKEEGLLMSLSSVKNEVILSQP